MMSTLQRMPTTPIPGEPKFKHKVVRQGYLNIAHHFLFALSRAFNRFHQVRSTLPGVVRHVMFPRSPPYRSCCSSNTTSLVIYGCSVCRSTRPLFPAIP